MVEATVAADIAIVVDMVAADIAIVVDMVAVDPINQI